MKKIISLICSFSLLISCGTVFKTQKNAEENLTTKEHIKNEQEMLIGQKDLATLRRSPYKIWFNTNYQEYKINEAIIEELKPLLKDIQITAFMGTWCSDSQRETPAFYKILEAAEYKLNTVKLIAVDLEKTTPDNLEEGLNIDRVPTFIFYRDGKELGRYVEYARASLEKDMVAILSGSNYKHSYED